MKKISSAVQIAFFLILVAIAFGAHANVIIGGTRVVFPAKEREVTVRLTNDNSRPALVETWIDDGNSRETPDQVKTPFLITPPLFRMEAHKDQSLRILPTTATSALPTDRETLYYLNVLEIPPKTDGERNVLQFSIRSRLKLFFRPDGLHGDPLKAPSELTWRVVSLPSGGSMIEMHNPTPYHVTVAEIKIELEGHQYDVDVGLAGMVSPFADLRLPAPALKHTPAVPVSVDYSVVNDYGAVIALKGATLP